MLKITWFFTLMIVSFVPVIPAAEDNTPIIPVHYSPASDTLYLKDVAIIKNSSGSWITDPPPALLGSAPGGFLPATTWGPELRLTYLRDSSQSIDSYPNFCVSGDTILVIFSSNDAGPIGSMPFIIGSTDAGQDWFLPRCISNPDTPQAAWNKFLRLHGGRTVVAGTFYGDSQFDHRNQMAKYSADLGESWSQPHFFFTQDQIFIGKSSGASSDDTILIGLTHVEDHNYEYIDSIKTSVSFDNGTTWSPLRQAIYHSDENYPFTLAQALGRVHLVFQERSENGITTEIFYTCSDDWGQTWRRPMVVSDDSATTSQWPSLSVSPDGKLVISWFDFKYGDGGGGFAGDILYRLSTDNAHSWGGEQRLTSHHNATASRSYAIGDQIGFIWVDHRTGFFEPELYYAESSDLGQTWSQELRLTDAEGRSDSPELILQSGNLFLIWRDARNDPPFGDEIYFRRADDVVDIWNDGIAVPSAIGITAYPNPFNSSVEITYSVLEGGDIKICNSLGQIIRKFDVDASIDGRIVWDGADQAGHQAASGTYFVKLSSGDQSHEMKLIYLK